ncbi:unnamed protein product [Merluccius merluccius]
MDIHMPTSFPYLLAAAAGAFSSVPHQVKAKKGVNLLQTKSKNAQWKVDWEVQSGAKHSITTIDVSKNKVAKAGMFDDRRCAAALLRCSSGAL